MALILLSRHRHRSSKLNLPPRPKPWSIIDNLNFIGSLPQRSIHDISPKYDDIMQLKFSSFDVVGGSSVEYIRIEEMKSLLKSIFDLAGKEILLKDLLSTVSLNVISHMVLGKRYLDESNESNSVMSLDEFRKMLDELLVLNDVFNIGDSIP
ncbi:hypothetical protein L6452_27820 [Arctium lappa]|uniref:Uncharacterized protein n=1 Tax=Arctium lappa TaxID=4217 RepID=A0ACB8ZX31_ARCLA|nr:hypothetical protein L6452_27820 [Arctium lappa]